MQSQSQSSSPLQPRSVSVTRFICLMMAVAVACAAVGNAQNADNDRPRCPDDCRCLSASKAMHCAAITQIPHHALPTDFATINFCQDRPFVSSFIDQSNLTRLATMERIFLGRCGLETIESESFAALRNLKYLDLSQNRLRTIARRTFTGLKLDTLTLSNNVHLQLNAESFAGLQVTHLKLDNCSLKQLDADVIRPLRNAGLRTLALPNNELTQIPRDLNDFISMLQRIELQGNPFACDCSMKWFIDLYQAKRQQNSELFGNVAKYGNLELYCHSSSAESASSSSSSSTSTIVTSRAFINVSTVQELQCYQPVVTDVRIDMTATEWKLVCAFEGNPMPSASVKVLDTVAYNQFVRRLNASVAPLKRIEVHLPIPGLGNSSDTYRCEASNELGSTSLAVDLTLPIVFFRALAMRNEAEAVVASYQVNVRPTTTPKVATEWSALRSITPAASASARNKTEADTAVPQPLCDGNEQFTVIEMIIAIVITFIGSSLLSFVIFRVAQSESVGDFFKSARSHNYTLTSSGYVQQSGLSRSNQAHEDSDMQQAALAAAAMNYAAQNAALQNQTVNSSVSSQSFRSLPNPNGLPLDTGLAQVHLAYRPQPPRPMRVAQTFGPGGTPTTYNTSMSINEFRHLNGMA